MTKISDREFRLAVTEAFQRYVDSLTRWERVEWVNRDLWNAKDRKIVRDAQEDMKLCKAVVMATLGTTTGLIPIDAFDPEIPRLIEAARKRRKG